MRAKSRENFRRSYLMRRIFALLLIYGIDAHTTSPLPSDVEESQFSSASENPVTTTGSAEESDVHSTLHALENGPERVESSLITPGPDMSFNEFMQLLDPNLGPTAPTVSLHDLINEIDATSTVPPNLYESLELSVLFNVASEASLQTPEAVWNSFEGGRLLAIAQRDEGKREHLLIALAGLVTNLGFREDELNDFAIESGFRGFCDQYANEFAIAIREDHRRNWRFRRVVRPASDVSSMNNLIARQTFLADLHPYCPRLFREGPVDVRLTAFMHHMQRRRLMLAYGGLSAEAVVDVDRLHAFSSWFIRRSRLGNRIGIGSVTFAGEMGEGAGVVRDWFREAAKQLFSQEYGLFYRTEEGYYLLNTTAIGSRTNWKSELKSVAHFLAYSIADQIPLGVNLPVTFVSRLTNSRIRLADIQSDDPVMYHSLTRLQSMDDVELASLGLTLWMGDVELPVHRETLELFIDRRINSIIPRSAPYLLLQTEFMKVIDELPDYILPSDLKQSIYGNPFINVEELIHSVSLHGYRPDSEQVVWLFDVLRSYEQSELRAFLSFVTGTPAVPVGGFASLQHPIMIIRSGEPETHLPRSRTCFNHFFLPQYSSEATLRERVSSAIGMDASMGIV